MRFRCWRRTVLVQNLLRIPDPASDVRGGQRLCARFTPRGSQCTNSTIYTMIWRTAVVKNDFSGARGRNFRHDAFEGWIRTEISSGFRISSQNLAGIIGSMRNLDQSTRLEPKMTILGDVACCGSEERAFWSSRSKIRVRGFRRLIPGRNLLRIQD